MSKITVDITSCSTDELKTLQAAISSTLKSREIDKGSGPYKGLLATKKTLDKELNGLLKTHKKFAFTVNVPLSFEAVSEQYANSISDVAADLDLFEYSGTLKMPKTIDGLNKAQAEVILDALQDYSNVCDDFCEPFAPKEIGEARKALKAKCDKWVAEVEEAGFDVNDFE